MAKIYSFALCRQKYEVKSVVDTINQEFADGTRKFFKTDKERHAEYVRNNPNLNPDRQYLPPPAHDEFEEINPDPDHWTDEI